MTKNNVDLDLLKVQAIYIIPTLKDSKSKRKKRQEETFENRQKKFGSYLKDATEELSQEPIKCKTNGYTRDAKPYTYQYESKEYKV